MLKLSGILLNYYYSIILFLIGLFLGYVLGRWTFLGQGLALRTFFGSNNFASFAHPRH